MWSITWSEIIGLVVTMLCGVVSAYLVPMIKERRLRDFVAECVRAAEMVFADQQQAGRDKYAWVVDAITERFGKIDEDKAELLIEAAVWGMKKGGS